MTAPVRLHRGTAGLDAAVLRPGADLVLDPSPEHGLALPAGVAVDDHLDDAARAAADRDAFAAMAAWRAARATSLTVDGVDLGFAWEIELLASCFLPATRLRHALTRAGVTAVEGAGLSEELLSVVTEAGIDARTGSGAGAAPALPKAPPAPLARLVSDVGVPPRVRGEVLALSYWHLEPVWRRLAAQRRPQLVPAGVLLPGVGRAGAMRAGLHGGWGGHPNAAARRRSAERLAAVLDGAGPPLDALDALALRMLRDRAHDTLARAAHWRRVLSARSLRLIVLPFDSPEDQRILLGVAREAGLPSLLVQHGFDSQLNDPDKSLADDVALWAERDVAPVAARASGALHVTGNPGAAHLAQPPARSVRAGAAAGPTVVLVDYHTRISARIDARISQRHVATALDVLQRQRPGTDVIVRPHPSDVAPASYLALATGRDLHVTVDAVTPIETLLADAGACVGALSTATLQAAALGVPTTFLDVTSTPRPWPFDGSPDGLPRIADVTGELASSAADAPAREALGARTDAIERVCDLVSSLARAGRA
ncbi:MAG TPA: hypothetical protein VK501_21290 [Baekduia sp.]|uniref:hypothetical protein n=1 Tax=Baekduia sp. TaxID=2600305 RepID=UPI002D09D452|nr:hypothetical protein [Baekduia sp.]HMJ36452.1 hypothetical protein [Baekduia sp.]